MIVSNAQTVKVLNVGAQKIKMVPCKWYIKYTKTFALLNFQLCTNIFYYW